MSKPKVVNFKDLAWIGGTKKDPGKFKRLIAKEDSNDLIIEIGHLEPKQALGLHKHPDASEFYYIIKGNGKVTVGDEVFQVTPNTAVYIPKNEKHALVNDSEDILEVLYGRNRYSVTVWEK